MSLKAGVFQNRFCYIVCNIVEYPMEAGMEETGEFEPQSYYETEVHDAGNAAYEDSFEYYSDAEQVRKLDCYLLPQVNHFYINVHVA